MTGVNSGAAKRSTEPAAVESTVAAEPETAAPAGENKTQAETEAKAETKAETKAAAAPVSAATVLSTAAGSVFLLAAPLLTPVMVTPATAPNTSARAAEVPIFFQKFPPLFPLFPAVP